MPATENAQGVRQSNAVLASGKVSLAKTATGVRFNIHVVLPVKLAAADFYSIRVEHLNPRTARVVALGVPSDVERGQWFFQRYVETLPTTGEMVLYDRSWYNRAGVERVMEFCEPGEYLEFMRQTPDLERMLVRSGIKLYKYWFSVTQKEQKSNSFNI